MLKHAPFALAVGLQLVLLALIPAQRMPIYLSGTSVRLEIAPYDPYSVMSGYYAHIRYTIGQAENLSPAVRSSRQGTTVYFALVKNSDGVWTVADTSTTWPTHLHPGEVVIRGEKRGGSVEFGIEDYYVPEDQRNAITQALRGAGGKAYADVKVNGSGTAVVERLIINGQVFEY